MELRAGYKQTEVGVIPKDWEVHRLGQVLTLQRGFDLPNRLRRRGSVPIVTSSGIEDFHSQSAVKGPGVVTGRYGTIGKVYFVEADFWPLNTTLWLRDFHGNEPLWAFRILQTVDFLSHSGKSGVPGVNRNDVHGEIICVPPLPEQRAIATALSDADALIASLDALIAKKRDLKQAAMQQLLTGKFRLPGFTGEWEVKQLGEIFEIGSSKRVFQSQWKSEGIPFYRAREVVLLGEGQPIENQLFISRALFESHKYSSGVPEAGDMLVTGVGTLGRVFVVQDSQEFYFKDGNIIWFKIRGKMSTEFLRQLFLTDKIMKQISEAAGGSTVGTYTISGAKKTVISFPSLGEQTSIAEVLSDMDAGLNALEAQRDKARALKQGMMQELLTGRIRLL